MSVRNKVYLAAPWNDRAAMPERAEAFALAGFEITQRWWEKESGLSNTGYTGDPTVVMNYAVEDMQGVVNADVVVVYQTGLSEGKAVEQGIALALGIPIVSVGVLGEVKNIFHFLPDYRWVSATVEAIKVIKGINGEV